MSDRTKKFEDELEELAKEGDMLAMAMEYDCKPQQFRDAYSSVFKGEANKLEKFINNLPSFGQDYQKWYSKAQAVVKQVLPDRLSDLVSHYEHQRVRKEIDFQNLHDSRLFAGPHDHSRWRLASCCRWFRRDT